MGRAYLPGIVGLTGSNPSGNVGEVKSEGFDGNFTFKQKLGKVNLTVRGNMTYGKNEILERDEENTPYWYKTMAGHRVDQAMGLIAMGLFKDYEEIRNWPSQFGDVMPVISNIKISMVMV